ncbi:hypothetical protein G7Y79_00078g099940 [Physcia stellaris]|nr:hypothetical protein G7Y79_00078g099940 [Physcia stellaris]
MLSPHTLLPFLLILVSTTTAIRPLLLKNASSPLTALSPFPFMDGVDTDRSPDWAGNFDPLDCRRARGLLHEKIDHWDEATRWKFWSRRWRTRPEGQQWELPYGLSFREWPSPLFPPLRSPRFLLLSLFHFFLSFLFGLCPSTFNHSHQIPYYHISSFELRALRIATKKSHTTETCTILLRIGKDFGDHVIPTMSDNSYMRTSILAPEAVLLWQELDTAMDLGLRSVRWNKRPTWLGVHENMREEGYVYVLFLPSRSAMARVWTVGMRAGKDGLEEGGASARGSGSRE